MKKIVLLVVLFMYSFSVAQENYKYVIVPKIRILSANSYLYASKRFSGEQILEFTKKNQEETNKKCNRQTCCNQTSK